jgi:hypothetical protein
MWKNTQTYLPKWLSLIYLWLSDRLPSDRLDGCPGHHWICESLIAHPPKIGFGMLMSDVHAQIFVDREYGESLSGTGWQV